MLYKCDHCDYSSKRLFDLRRHENKKKQCYKKLEEAVCKIEDPENVSSLRENVIHESSNFIPKSLNVIHESSNLTNEPLNVTQ